MRNFPPRLIVRAGQVISIGIWNLLMLFLRGCRLIAGRGVRLDTTPDGTTITFDPGASSRWQHSFRCALQSDYSAVEVGMGLVNGLVPTIADVPLDAVETNTLPLAQPRLGNDGRGWIAVECVLGDKWEVLSASIVHVANLDTDTGEPPPEGVAGFHSGGTLTLPGRRARWPLALLRRRDDGRLVLFQITHFDLMHRAAIAKRADGTPGESGRHFFSAAP